MIFEVLIDFEGKKQWCPVKEIVTSKCGYVLQVEFIHEGKEVVELSDYIEGYRVSPLCGCGIKDKDFTRAFKLNKDFIRGKKSAHLREFEESLEFEESEGEKHGNN